VTLRTHLATDLDPVFERCLDEDTKRFTTIPLEYTRELAEEYLASIMEPSEELISWAIEVGGEYAGTIDLRVLPVDAGAGALGFVTHPRFRGRGVMSEAVGVVVSHALDTLGWQLVRWEAHAGNVGSAKAVWRNGFPVPTFVPDALLERGAVLDGWISTLRVGMAREPVAPWNQVYAALAAASA
jgi:RimJ/RimL family protein N-acetyltransferase